MRKILVMLLMTAVDLSFGPGHAQNMAIASSVPDTQAPRGTPAIDSSASVTPPVSEGQSANEQVQTLDVGINCAEKSNETEMWNAIQTSFGDSKITSFAELQATLAKITEPTTVTLTNCNTLPFSFETPEAGDAFRENLIGAINDAVAVNGNLKLMYW